MRGIVEFLRAKYNFDEQIFTFEELQKILEYEGVAVEVVGEDEVAFNGMICWGDGSQHKKRPIVFLRQNYDSGHRYGGDVGEGEMGPAGWFALAHEFSHFYLHPYLKFTAVNKEASRKRYPELAGITQLEADQMATMALLPTKELSDNFEERLINIFLDSYFSLIDGTDEELWLRELVDIKCDMLEYCTKRTKAILGIDKLTDNANRNLCIRVIRYVAMVEEKIVIFFKGMFPDIYHYKMDKSLLVSQISQALKTYEEKI